ncbi:acetyl-CoA carboxylase biotin carboxyl carrier protein subunit [Dactylosporangium aurantiacum]|uniref:Biotin carboxyl carrier protein of acetyl-CoA carboxylase n=1 Tax=Dactylosporangium aurantiacum TaxID=35754 RepID=A0A9Q9IC84_9ACTN|nr:biotin/lipoyl-containing protein [Dactylosporangium aurantiacum]MDG6106618.1 acetyl-CoA carboxylase biotin carboxyl carrier protein subunit [Dactylosporangium aurantiacum]UWZ50779.1 acetyl-CoA carboxylase biotin carboxyl carrier protein subunit [Dactylosporangium aurantiacum]
MDTTPERDRPAVAELSDLRDAIVEVLTSLPRPPSRLRIQAADVGIDIRWEEEPAPARPGREPAPVTAAAPVAAAAPAPAELGPVLVAPSVGVFYQAPSPGSEPFVTVGTVVEAGQQIGIVEAMKLMIPIFADRAGTITAVLKADGTPVEYDEPLFALAEQV